MVLHRLVISLINVIFPPVSVALLTGMGSAETLTNCMLFLLAVIPAQVHSFIVSWRYFGTKRKQKKINDKKIINLQTRASLGDYDYEGKKKNGKRKKKRYKRRCDGSGRGSVRTRTQTKSKTKTNRGRSGLRSRSTSISKSLSH